MRLEGTLEPSEFSSHVQRRVSLNGLLKDVPSQARLEIP